MRYPPRSHINTQVVQNSQATHKTEHMWVSRRDRSELAAAIGALDFRIMVFSIPVSKRRQARSLQLMGQCLATCMGRNNGTLRATAPTLDFRGFAVFSEARFGYSSKRRNFDNSLWRMKSLSFVVEQ
jgi:hypothetical protein